MHCRTCGREMRRVNEPYPYSQSGLDNVFLLGTPVFRCECGELVAKIPRMAELHRVLAEFIATKPAPLTGQELRYLRKSIGLKAVELAQDLGVTKSTVSRWENEEERIGPANDRLVRLIFAIKTNPAKSEDYVRQFHAIKRERARRRRIELRKVGDDYQAEYVDALPTR